jgi:hypothetical protein
MEKWISHSSPTKQALASITMAAVGLLMVYLTRDFGPVAMTDKFCAFLLGLLLLVVGAAGIAATGVQTIVIDPKLRRIEVTDKTVFGIKNQVIFFHDIVRISIGAVGKRSNNVMFYFLRLERRNAPVFSLFAPGRFFEGSSNREVVEDWRCRLQEYIGLPENADDVA